MKLRKLILGMVIFSLFTLLLAGCSAQSTGTIAVNVTDALPKEVTAVEIKASNIEAHLEGADESKWVTLLKDPPIFDLVKISGVNYLLGTAEIAAGKYTQVRLDITEVKVTIEGKQVSATVPSGNIRLVGEIVIEAGKQTSISLDFDGEKSIVLEGQDKVSLKPVVKLIVGAPASPVPTGTSSPTPTP